MFPAYDRAVIAQEAPSGIPQTYFLPSIAGPPPIQILVAAAYIDSAVAHEPDEAILLWNSGTLPVTLAGWSLRAGNTVATFPLTSTLTLAPQARIWCAAQTASFRLAFGAEAGCAWTTRDTADTLMLDGAPTLVNSGGALILLDAEQRVADALLYGRTSLVTEGWQGAPAQLYTRGLATASGQIWQRKLNPITGLPIDTDTAADWAGDLSDAAWGRRVRQPAWGGWDRGDGLWPHTGVDSAAWAVAVGPEGLYAPLATFFSQATATLDLSLYTFEHPEFAMLVADAARRGVRVRLLLDGAPPGGISDVQRWCVTQMAVAGVEVRYLALTAAAPSGYKRRFRYTHAKYGIADNRQLFVGTENLTQDAMPAPAESAVGGRRGFYLYTDTPGVVATLSTLFATDWRPTVFADMHPYEASHARYGAPPADFTLPAPRVYTVTVSPFGETTHAAGRAAYAVISAPENALRPDAGILGIVAAAGAGDEIVAMQMYEDKHWGETSSNPIADPNPRLEAMIDAARRGARVRLLLDRYFDDADALRSNRATVEYLRTIAASEGLDLEARLGNPTAGGIHAKLVLLRVGEQYWSAVGSLNGGETSHKLNREVVLMVEQRAIFERLSSVFAHDWSLSE